MELGQLEYSMGHHLLAASSSLFFPRNVKLIILNDVVNVHDLGGGGGGKYAARLM